MPLALDKEIFRYVLSTDRSKPEKDRPTLLFYFPTWAQQRDIAMAFDQSCKTDSIYEMGKLRFDAIRTLLCGWENFPIPYDPSKLEEVLSIMDVKELLDNLILEMNKLEVEKKRSALSLPATTDAEQTKSVAPATEDDATKNTSKG